jgi:hypothetical protein
MLGRPVGRVGKYEAPSKRRSAVEMSMVWMNEYSVAQLATVRPRGCASAAYLERPLAV